MEIILKISNNSIIQGIINDLGVINYFFKESFENQKISNLDLSFNVIYELNEYNEPEYEIDINHDLKIEINGKTFKFNVSSLNDDFFAKYDDEIHDQLTRYLENKIKDNDKNNFDILKEKIEKVNPIESLYYRVKLKQEKDLSYENQIDLLYYIITCKSYIKDMEVVKDFLDNYYESKYAEVATIYFSLPNHYYERILKDDNVSQAIKKSILERKQRLPSVDEILETKNSNEIEKYYFNIWKNESIENKSEIVNKLLKAGIATENMIFDLEQRYPIEQILSDILRQKKVPEKFLLRYLNVNTYFLSKLYGMTSPHILMLENESTSSLIISRFFNEELPLYKELKDIELLIDLVKNHKNTDEMIMKKINDRIEVLSQLKQFFNSLINESDYHVLEALLNDLIIKSKEGKIFYQDINFIIDQFKDKKIEITTNMENQLNELKGIFSNLKEINQLVINKRKEYDFSEEEFTSVLHTRNDVYNDIIRKLKNINQIEELFKTELEQHIPILPASQRLKSIMENEEFQKNKDKNIKKIIYAYKRDFVHYLNNLIKTNNFNELFKIFNMLINNEGYMVDNVISFGPEEISKIEHTITDLNINNEEVLNNVIQLKRKILKDDTATLTIIKKG